MELVTELRELIDRTQFEVDELALHLAFEDATTIVEWVRGNIAYEPYSGLLRGPEGTLMGRAGNALDQAVLLASLLSDVGYEVRVAEARLSETDARQLLAGAFEAVDPPSILTDEVRFEEVLHEVAALGGLPPDRVDAILSPSRASDSASEDDTMTQVLAMTAQLRSWLDGAGVEVLGEPVESVLEDARSYHWVQYRLVAEEPWLDAHPAFVGVDGDAGLEVVPSRTFAGSVPEDLLHRFRFEVVVERRVGTELVPASIAARWEQPVANLVGKPVSFVNYPILDEWPELGTDGIVAQDPLFAPLLNRELFPGAELFDLSGAMVPPDAAANPAAGVVRNVGGAFGRAAGAVGGESSPEAFVTLVAQHLDFTLIAPGGIERRYRRTLVDKLSPSLRASDDIDVAAWNDATLAPLLAETTFMVSAGVLAPGFILDRYLERLIALESVIGATVRAALQPDKPLSRSELDLGPEDSVWLGHLSLYALFDVGTAGLRTFRSEPSLVLYQDAIAYGLPDASIDIVTNGRRSLGASGSPEPTALMLAGVWETAVEGLVLGTPVEARHGTFDVFAAAEAAGVEVRVITPLQSGALGEIELSEDARHHAASDLEAGYVVVIPVRPVGGRTAWWRVDLESGQTLGVLESGQGGEITQYEVLVSVGFGTIAFLLCLAGQSKTGNSTGKMVTDCGKVGLATSAVIVSGLYMPIAGGAGGPAIAFAFWTAVAALTFEVTGLMFPE